MTERCSDRVATALKDRGVRRVYGIPGGETVHMVDSLESHGLEMVITRHENSAAFMGLVGARYDRHIGVCLTTIGPGAANVVMGAGTATLDFAPLLVMTGELPLEERGHPRKQCVDQRSMFAPVTKGSFEADPKDPYHICTIAMDLAESERPGAVHLSLPADVMAMDWKGSYAEEAPSHESENVAHDLGAAIEMIYASKRPLALIGAGVIRAGATDTVRDFIHSNRIPALHTWQGSGVVPFDDPMSLHTVGLPCNKIPMQCIEEADLIITIGYDEQEFQPSIWNPEGGKKVLHISRNPPQTVPSYSPFPVIGGIAPIIGSLQGIRPPGSNWADAHRMEYEEHISREQPGDDGIDPVAAIKELRKRMRGSVVVSDVGAHMLWLAEYLPPPNERSLIISNGMIPMGMGLAGAIGVAFTDPGVHSMTVTGDAGLLMCIAELQTALEHDLPVTSLVWNDAALGLIDTRHCLALDRNPAYRLERTDMARVAESLGAKGIVVDRLSQLSDALDEAHRSDLPTVIDMRVDYSRNRSLLV